LKDGEIGIILFNLYLTRYIPLKQFFSKGDLAKKAAAINTTF
jgi:hypothetical protein